MTYWHVIGGEIVRCDKINPRACFSQRQHFDSYQEAMLELVEQGVATEQSIIAHEMYGHLTGREVLEMLGVRLRDRAKEESPEDVS